MDRRNVDRVSSRLFVEIESSNLKGIAYTADISPGGCQLHAAAPLPPGSHVSGQFLVGNQPPVPFQGEVRWSSAAASGPGEHHLASLGVHFTDSRSTH